MACHYPWPGVEEAKPKQGDRLTTQLCCFLKTELQYNKSSEDVPKVMARDLPCGVTELTELQERCSQLPEEPATEYVWSLSHLGRQGEACWR